MALYSAKGQFTASHEFTILFSKKAYFQRLERIFGNNCKYKSRGKSLMKAFRRLSANAITEEFFMNVLLSLSLREKLSLYTYTCILDCFDLGLAVTTNDS